MTTNQFTQEKVFTNAEQTNWIVKHFRNGVLQREDPYTNGVLSGTARVYGANGEVTAELTVARGVLEGTAKYYSGGQLTHQVEFERGRPKAV